MEGTNVFIMTLQLMILCKCFGFSCSNLSNAALPNMVNKCKGNCAQAKKVKCNLQTDWPNLHYCIHTEPISRRAGGVGGRGWRRRGALRPPSSPQFWVDQLKPYLNKVGQIMPTTLLHALPGFSDLPTALQYVCNIGWAIIFQMPDFIAHSYQNHDTVSYFSPQYVHTYLHLVIFFWFGSLSILLVYEGFVQQLFFNLLHHSQYAFRPIFITRKRNLRDFFSSKIT